MATALSSSFTYNLRSLLRRLVPYRPARFIPLRQSCLPELAHYARPSPRRVAMHAPPGPFAVRSPPQLSDLCSTWPLSARALSLYTFRGEPATRLFVWSFAPMPSSCHRFAHQNGSLPPAVFRQPSQTPGIVHKSIGSHPRVSAAFAAPPALRLRLAARVLSLVRVSRRGRAARLPAQFHLFSLFLLRSLYFSTIGLAAVFSLGWTLPPIHGALPNTATPHAEHPRGCHPLRPAVPGRLSALS